MDLRYSEQLVELPDLSMAHRLEIVDLYHCIKLRTVHPSILSLHTLVKMDVSWCLKLESLESEIHLESLSNFLLWSCHNLKRFCLSSKKLTEIDLARMTIDNFHLPSGKCTELRKLRLNGSRLRSLPIDELCCLTNLEVFKVTNFKQVIDTMKLHSLFYAWRNLRKLHLNGWSWLSEIPDGIKGLIMLESLRLDGTTVVTLPAWINHLSSLTKISLRMCKSLKSILGLPPCLKELDTTECTLLETVSSDSLPLNLFWFDFYNCVKLDEHTLCFIEELIHSSVTSDCDDEYYEYPFIRACYPRSRVPKWMKYKQMTKASNTIQFNCNLEQSLAIVFGCVAPHHLVSEGFESICCDFSYDNYKLCYEFDDTFSLYGYEEFYFEGLNSDHVFLWCLGRDSFGDGRSNNAKITCEFFIMKWNEEYEEYKVPVEACRVHVIYEWESDWKRKRDDDFICHPLQYKFIRNTKQKDLSLIHSP